MLVIYNFALSTHLIVDTGCQLYLHMSYISMFAYYYMGVFKVHRPWLTH